MRQRLRVSDEKKEEISPSLTKTTIKSYSGWPLFLFLVLFRIFNALTCLTAHVPDEQWQSLEVAHQMVFKCLYTKGHLTWEWKRGIRGYTHPLIFAILYKLLYILGIDTPYIIEISPKLLQGLIAAVSDWYMYSWSLLMFSCHDVAHYTLITQCLSWFTYYCCTRTLSNTIESSLTPIILYYWWKTIQNNSNNNNNKDTVLYLLLSSFSILVRPTGVVMWAPLVLYQLVHALGHKRNTGRTLVLMFIVGSLSLLWSLVVDRFFYGKWVFVQLEFLKFNILQGQSAMFGTHPWHWYITQGLPVVLFTGIPLIIHGIYSSITLRSSSSYPLLLTPVIIGGILVIVHTLISHKEFRFVLPLLPLTMPYVGFSISLLMKRRKVMKCITWLLLLSNIPMSLYFCLIHQRGGYAVMRYLQQNISSESRIMFLMPCHSTPLYSYLHGNHEMNFLECLPESGQDVEKEFYTSPNEWLTVNIQSLLLPTHIICYDVLVPLIEEFLNKNHYEKVLQLFHAHYIDDERVGHSVLLYYRKA